MGRPGSLDRGFAIAEDIGDAVRIVDDVKRHDDAGMGERRLVDAHGVEPVRQQHCDLGCARKLQRGECRAPFACAFAGLSPARALPAIRRRVELAVGLGLGALRYAPGEQLGEGLYVLNVVGGDCALPVMRTYFT